MSNETPAVFGQHQSIGMIHNGKDTSCDTGVVIVVGGPQYRIGSHRQFLKLSRSLAANNVTSIRFDCSGMGDSGGEFKSYLNIDEDIKSAIDTLQSNCPHISKIVLWGLCDAATAIAKYCNKDTRISGVFLLNPWVKDEQLAAEALVKNHYKKQLLSLHFWKRVISGDVKIFSAVSSFIQNLLNMKSGHSKQQNNTENKADSTPKSLQQMMQQELQQFSGKAHIILSENDLTAQEFNTAAQSQQWQKMIKEKPIPITTIPGANHTFASEKWRSEIQDLTLGFVGQI